MRLIIDFFEYTISGWIYLIYFIVMMIFSFACLGVVGEKVSKKKYAELMAKRERAAQEEYRKAQELIERQAQSYGVNNVIDPTAPVANNVQGVVSQSNIDSVNNF
jgi:hypothetical protein